MRRLVSTEEQEQRALLQWIALHERQYPALRLFFHVANGGKRPKGEAGKMRGLGQRAGVPDLFLLVPRGHFHGLAIELKAPGGRATNGQLLWIGALREHGYCAEICQGWEQARTVIEKYLAIGQEGTISCQIGLSKSPVGPVRP
jgi:hypothetical protein